MKRKDRVQAHTDREVNEQIEAEAERRVLRASGLGEAAISREISQLEEEWDIERWLEANAAALAFTGTVLGLLVNRKFFAIPCVVLPLLFQHAVQGWCPPIPFLRRAGVRTRKEIDSEKYALKALRGDFDKIEQPNGDSMKRGQMAWRAANA